MDGHLEMIIIMIAVVCVRESECGGKQAFVLCLGYGGGGWFGKQCWGIYTRSQRVSK